MKIKGRQIILLIIAIILIFLILSFFKKGPEKVAETISTDTQVEAVAEVTTENSSEAPVEEVPVSEAPATE